MVNKIYYPHTATTTWSGYIYQGYVAIYHSIKCLQSNDVFELQLDSIDDFAIIIDGVAVSTHQVKALGDTQRSEYLEALAKAASVTRLCNERTTRYFHVSSKLDDFSEYTSSDGVVVKFYTYAGVPYCALQDIISKIKLEIESYLKLNGLPCSNQLVELKYESLQCRILSQITYIHAATQDNLMTAKEAAYTQTIKSVQLKELLEAVAEFDSDKKYKMYKARLAFAEAFDQYAKALAGRCDVEAYHKVVTAYGGIKSLSDAGFEVLWKTVCLGSGVDTISKTSVFDYVDILLEIVMPPIVDRAPYYVCGHKQFYLPTAYISKSEVREDILVQDIFEEIKSNGAIFEILFEYDWLIADVSTTFSLMDRYCTFNGVTADMVESEYKSAVNVPSKITKAFGARIISKADARGKIDD